ncbi:hypothetical protein B0A48_02882 [Cryoendolithus antarcticus]|uniref:Uncharacterized protein n=1 Tax=Cryoendolithus antarcticus TaxID=1507870 RepID=A0A1V8TLW3_9PEZI|nr:hypothetical protein B0A48_02882 [Cryoendolithus antarcticus]
MSSNPHLASIPSNESPSNSETAVTGNNAAPKDSTPAAKVPDTESKIGSTKMSAEEAADKLYAERIEEEGGA